MERIRFHPTKSSHELLESKADEFTLVPLHTQNEERAGSPSSHGSPEIGLTALPPPAILKSPGEKQGDGNSTPNSGLSEDERLEEDEDLYHFARGSDLVPRLHTPTAPSLSFFQRGQQAFNSLTAVVASLPNIQQRNPTERRPRFDNDMTVIVGDDSDYPDDPVLEYTIPFGPHYHETYRFEIEHPNAADTIRRLNAMPSVQYAAAVAHSLRHRASAGLDNIARAYEHASEACHTAGENLEPAFRAGRALADGVVNEAWELGNAAQRQWREWSPWLDMMIDSAMTPPNNRARGWRGR